MRRKLPNVTIPSWKELDKRTKWTLQLKVITPMFGGGYKVREVDPICVIRPAAIRGHLRFWWRATAGVGHLSEKQLFESEAKLWGSTENSGLIMIRTNLVQPGSKKKHSELAPKEVSKYGPREGYFLFPFQAQRKENLPEAEARKEAQFEFHLLIGQYWNDEKKQLEDLSPQDVAGIKNAVKAWVVFGGVGARTRRGCGALQVMNNDSGDWMPPSRDKQQLESWMKSLRDEKPAGSSYTHLKGARIIIGEECFAKDNLSATEVAWRTLGTFWARFRKGHIPPVRATYEPTSNCDWDDYRQVLVKNYFPKNPRPKSLAIAKPFLGLPIIYQRFDNAPYTRFTIEAVETGRMSSAVILKPIIFADGAVCPMVAVLSAPQPSRITIEKHKLDLAVPTSDKVLTALKVSHPLEAVVEAAKQIWGSSNVLEVTL
jgi:CRISPR-associated protein Cmr1